jgi:hypothetical protein
LWHWAGNRLLQGRRTRESLMRLRHRASERRLLWNRPGNRLLTLLRRMCEGLWLRRRQKPALLRLRHGTCERLRLWNRSDDRLLPLLHRLRERLWPRKRANDRLGSL